MLEDGEKIENGKFVFRNFKSAALSDKKKLSYVLCKHIENSSFIAFKI